MSVFCQLNLPSFANVGIPQRDCRRDLSLQWGPSSSNPCASVSCWFVLSIILFVLASFLAFPTLPPQGLSLKLLSVEDIWKPKVRKCIKIRNPLELPSWSQSWPALQLLERKELSTCWEAPWNSQSVPLSTSCNYISHKAFNIKTSWCVIFTW